MAATWLKPLHVGKGKTIAEAISDITDYAGNPEKTLKGDLVTGYECDPKSVDAEFLLSKRQYYMKTGRDQGGRDVIAYHTRQSFRPGEVTPEEANRIGHEIAMSLTKGKHAFIVATHVDKAHIHNHIVFNSTSLDYSRKFRNFIGSAFALRRISDRVCLEHGLSIIENPKPSRGSYGTWLGSDKPLSYQEKLRCAIDDALGKKPVDFEAFLSVMETMGYEVKRGKYLAFRTDGQEKFTRCRESTLGEDYTEEAIRERISGRRSAPVKRGGLPRSEPSKPDLLIDIQACLQAGKGPGYERWAKLFNLKQAAQTLNYLQEHGGMGYDELVGKTEAASERFNILSDKMKELEKNLSDNSELQKQIITYSKTRATYVEYRKAGYSKRFKETHEADIILHQSAKKYFDSLGLTKLPTVAALRSDYAVLLEEKKKVYRDYLEARKEMRELLIVKANVDQLLNIPERKRANEKNEPTI